MAVSCFLFPSVHVQNRKYAEFDGDINISFCLASTPQSMRDSHSEPNSLIPRMTKTADDGTYRCRSCRRQEFLTFKECAARADYLDG